MMMKRWVLCFAAAAGIVSGLASPASAQDLERVRTLYAAAAYEEALAAVPAANDSVASTEIELYRALCQLALGKEGDARSTIERLVRAHPAYQPPSSDVSPRMQAIFGTVRAEVLPSVVRAVYTDAKAAYDEKRSDDAVLGFARAIALIDSLPDAQREGLADLRLLASDFGELMRTKAAAAAAPAEPVAPLPSPAAKPSGPFVAAAAIEERLPAWNPPDTIARRSEYEGLLRVEIDASGRVTSARIVEPSHPAYDAVIVESAKRWTYRAATVGGQAVSSFKDLKIRLVPQLARETR